MLLGSQIHFLPLKQHLSLVHTVSLPTCKNNAIHCTMFVSALNDAKNIFLSKNIVIHVSFIHALCPYESAARLTTRAISHTLFNVEGLSCTLSTRFEPLYMNMYYIGPSDGAMSLYVLRLEIYRATSISTNSQLD